MRSTLSAWALVLACVLAPGTGQADKSGTRPQVLSVPRGPGSVGGLGESFEVNLNSGSVSEVVALQVPPGTGGLVPRLALAYDSGAGNGPLGLGWSLPVSHLQVQTERGLPRYEGTDRYLLDGGELVRVGPDTWRYRNEGAFVRARRSGAGWEVALPGGSVRRYGLDADSRVEQAGQVFAWYLEDEVDGFGNRVSYYYTKHGGRPYLVRVEYNRRAGAADNRVELEYEARGDVLTDYRATYPVTTAWRLARVRVRALGHLVRRYELSYHSGAAFSLLHTVRMYGEDDRTALPPLTFHYTSLNSSPALHRMAEAPVALPGSSPDAELEDMDGDGFPDLLVAASGDHRWYRNLGGSAWAPRQSVPQSPAVALGTAGVDLADVNGDGLVDLVARTGVTTQAFRYFPNLGRGSWQPSVVMANNPSFAVEDGVTRWVDLDHDKRVDALRLTPTSVTWWRNEGGGAWAPAQSLPLPPGGYALDFADARVKLADMNGDRLLDLVWVRSGSVVYWPARGRGLFDSPVAVPGAPEVGSGLEDRLHLADLSGDGLADLVYVDTSHVDCWTLSPTGAFEPRRTLEDTPYANASLTQVRVGDMNGNGTLDVVWFTPSAEPGERVAYMDIQQGVRPYLLAGVENGLGLRRTLRYTTSAEQYQAALEAGQPWTTRVPFAVQVLAESMLSDSRGGEYVTRYRYAQGYYDGGTREFRGFGRVAQEQVGEAADPTVVQVHEYDLGLAAEALKGRELSREVRGAEGQRWRRDEWTLRARTYAAGLEGVDCVGVETLEQRTWLYEGTDSPVQLRETWAYDGYGNPVRHERYGRDAEGEPRLGEDEVFTTRTFANEESRWVLGRLVEEWVEDSQGRRLAASRSYYDGEAFVGLPLGQVTLGQLTRQERWVEGDTWVQAKRLQRDEYGNVVAQLSARGARREVEYDALTHTVPVRERVYLEGGKVLQFSAAYRAGRGLMEAFTDMQGSTTRFAYDALERLVALARPGDSLELPTYRYGYTLGTPVSQLTTLARPASGEERVELSHGYYDGLGRKLAEVSQAEAGQWVVSARREYSRRGAVLREWDAAFAAGPEFVPEPPPVPSVTHAYDVTGRLVRSTFPDGTAAEVRYAPLRRELWDGEDLRPDSPHQGTPLVQEEDGLGRVVAVTERLGSQPLTTRWSYDGLGRRLAVTNAAGHTTRYAYDGLGRLVELVHPEAGRRQLFYDEDGNVTRWKDAAGNQVERSHDVLGRLLEEVLVGADGVRQGQVRYHYDEPSPRLPGTQAAWALGRLSWVEDMAGEEHFAYDSRGRLVDNLRAVEGREYLTRQAFDNLDHVVALTYPDGTTLQYVYNERGLLASVPGVVDSLEYNAQGLPVRRQYANGVVATARYDAHDRVAALSAVDSTGKLLQGLRYSYDRAGTLTQVVDEVHLPSALSASRSYLYDSLSRLLEVRGPAGNASYSYDSVGNLLSKSDLGVYAYDSQAQPNAVRSVAGSRLEHDANGAVLFALERRFSYNAQGQLVRVEAEGATTEYGYDFEGHRVLKRVKGQGQQSTTVYVDRYSEERDGVLLKYVFSGPVRLARVGGGTPRTLAALSAARQGLQQGLALLALGALALAATLVARGGQALRLARLSLALGMASALAGCSCGPGAASSPHTTYYYYLADHLQSTTTLTDSAGQVVAQSAYDVWGQQLVASSEPYAYTGHEWDSEAGLYYAGNRYYDPRLGRFLSVDPATLEDAGLGVEDPQLLNPYAYARNTPTSLADRDGRLPHVLVGALAGVVVNTGVYLAKGAITGEAYTVRGALAAAAGGAVSGALAVASGGLSLAATAAAAGASNVATGVAERAITTGSGAESFSPQQMATDAAMGLVTFGLVKGGSAVAGKVLGPVRERLGAGLRWVANLGKGGCSGQCGVASKGCFVAGTLVLLATGQQVPIERLAVGERVAAPASATQPEQVAAFEVLDTSRRTVAWVVDIGVEAESGHLEVLTSTLDHPLLRRTRTGTEWVQAAQVRAGDTLASPQGTLRVRSLHSRAGSFEVFNLTVDSAHAYLVGSSHLVVHNGAYGGGKAGSGSGVDTMAGASLDDLSRAAGAADRAGLTKAGRALEKHGSRPGSSFPKATGTVADKNQMGQDAVDDILTAPNSSTTSRRHARFGDVTEIRTPDGRGVRYDSANNFIGFLEP